MRETLESKISSAKNLLDVLLILKEVTMRDTHVATLAYLDENIKEWSESSPYGIWRCRPFPLEEGQPEYNIQAYYFTENGNTSNEDLKKNKIVVILFMDRNFINNLQAVDETPKTTYDLTLHSLKFGVILNTL